MAGTVNCDTTGTDIVRAGLLVPIRDKPDDDIPRLAYADWPTDNGCPMWAAFISLTYLVANPDPLVSDLRNARLIR